MIASIVLLGVIVFVNTELLSVDILALTAILLIIAYKYKRHSKLDLGFYIVACLVTVAGIIMELPLVSDGVLGFALFNTVLFTGVLPNQWQLSKKLKNYRAFYSILGFLLVIGHAYTNLFVDKEINLFGVAAFVIMLPLFITSFNIVRKEMKKAEWDKLQKAAYIVYVLLFVHLISVADWYGKVIYAVLMTLYINNKLLKEFRK